MTAPRSYWPGVRAVAAACLVAATSSSCIVKEVTYEPPPEQAEMAPGETRSVVLLYSRFDVEDFEQVMTIDDLSRLPLTTLEKVWLLDYDPSLLMNAVLDDLKNLSPSEADELSVPAQNMRKLLKMTPDTADLTGTNLEEAIALAQAVNIPPGRVLADLLAKGVTEEVLTSDVATQVIRQSLIASHPNGQTRRGAVTADHPDGIYDVTPGTIPVTLADVVTEFRALPERFGPMPLDPEDPNSLVHPGFITDASGIPWETTMTVKANINALPYEGVDPTYSRMEYVNSVPSQIDTMFDFSDPEWMKVEGLGGTIVIDTITMAIIENDSFIPGGISQDPVGQGDSPVWDLPPWEFEQMIAEMAKVKTDDIPAHCDEYKFGTGTVAFRACISQSAEDEPAPEVPWGWTELRSFGDIGDPPPPAYLWDVLLEVVQVRLHDGGLAEGQADVEFTLKNVEIDVDEAEEKKLVDEIKANFQEDPGAFVEVAKTLVDSATGDPDFYYYRPDLDNSVDIQGDYLYFVEPADLRVDDEGELVRPYAYEKPGFFRDEGLNDKVSSTMEIDGDTTREKVKIQPGDVLFIQDDRGVRFRINVGEKPSKFRVALDITRL